MLRHWTTGLAGVVAMVAGVGASGCFASHGGPGDGPGGGAGPLPGEPLDGDAGARALFSTRHRVAIGAGPHDLTVADVDGNGALDILSANAQSADVSVVRGRGDGTFGARQDLPMCDTELGSVSNPLPSP